MNTCTSKKRMYPSEFVAEEALIAAWTAYNFTKNNGPIGIYVCENCGSYHLTSKGPINKRLLDFIESGQLNKNAEGNRWLDKVKKRK